MWRISCLNCEVTICRLILMVFVRSASLDVNVLVIDVFYVVLISVGWVRLCIHECVLWRQTDRKNTYFHDFKFLEKVTFNWPSAFWDVIDRLRTGRDVFAIALFCHCHKTTSIRVREWFPKSWYMYVKYRPLAEQPSVTTSPLDGSLLWVHCRYSSRPATVTTIRIIDIREQVSQQTDVRVFVQEYR